MNRSGIILAGFLAAGLSGIPSTASAQEAVNAEALSGRSPAPESAAAMPWCVFLSLRKTLNDIVYIDQILGNEVSQLLTDTNYLYSSWGSYGESHRSGHNSGSRAAIVKRAGYEEQYTGIWSLYSDVQALSAKMNAVSEEARNFEKEWWSIRAAMKRELKNGGTGEKSAPRLDKLRKNLAGLSSRYGYINSQAPSLQSQYDYNRTGYLQFINSAAADDNKRGAPVDIPEPWHWQYRNSQIPRAEMNYDFEESYGKYFKMSHNELHTGLPASRGGSK